MKKNLPFFKEKITNRSPHSMRQSFMRDYLLASIPAILLLLLIMSAGALFAMTYFANLLQSSNRELNNSAETHLNRLGEQIIQTKAHDVARQVEIYLSAHPNVTMAELQADPYFKEIAVQKVGETGYTTLYEAGTGITRIHPNPALINKDMSFLAEKLPSFWAVFEPSLSGKEVAGYYDWIEADNTIRKKYMVMTPVSIKLQNVTLMIASTTYIDEFSAPIVAMREQTENISRQYQSVVRKQGLILVGSGLGIIAVTLFIVYGLGRRATLRYIQPVEQLAKAVAELGAGNWKVAHLGETPARQDEIGALARAFQSMETQLHNLFNNQEQLVKERTQQLQREKQFLESLILNSPVAIIVMNLEGAITTWNPVAEKLFGYTQSEAIGRNIDDLVATETMRVEAVDYSNQTMDGTLIHAITQRNRKDGTPVDVELLSVPVIVEGNRVGAVAMYHDITELQRARRAAEAATLAKSEFLANMSHEIRTPMNGVIGMTSLVLDTTLSDEQREYVETIRKSGDALLSIINDILDFSKIEAGKLELEMQPFDLFECVESAADLVAYRASEQGVELLTNIELDVPHAVIGDVTRLRQIIANLLGNAVKFTEAGEIEVAVKKEEGGTLEDGECKLHFSVRDTGVGIPPDRANRLFQVFSQIDASTTRKFGGTGLGLAICKRLAELMGGDIWAESEGIGTGTTFHFVLPFRVAEQIRKTSQHSPHIVLREKSLLVVDDNATNRLIVNRMARSWGMSTVDCDSGREALEKIDAGVKVDAAVLDVQMPDMDGITLSGELRQRQGERELPLIIISSLGQKLPLPPGVNASAYLHKPIKPSQLYNALISAFDKQTERHESPAPLKTGFDAQMGERHPLRILLAEDHMVNQKVMKLMLERLGYRADVVANGLEALQSFKRRDYDVVLMDIQMPEMNGIEATQRLRVDLPPERQPRIIALTANALGGEREEYLAAGMDDYLSKPVNVAAMRAALEKCMPLEINYAIGGSHPMPEPIAPPASSAPVPDSGSIDIPTLKEYFPYEGEDIQLIIDLAEEFLADTDGRMNQLQTYIQQNDAESVGNTAHAIKGASLTFGARNFSALCKDIELIGKSGNLSGAAEKITEAQTEYERVRIELPRVLKGMLP